MEERVGRERGRQVQLNSENVFRLVGVLFAALVAADGKTTVERWWRRVGIGFPERDLAGPPA